MNRLYSDNPQTSNTLGQEEKIAIGSYPDGAVEKVMITVPDGQVVQSMNIDLKSADLATSTAYSFSESVDFASSTSYDGVNVNTSSLSLLPQEWSWDFETGSFGPEWTLSGTSNWNIQTGNVLSGSRSPQAGTITHNQQSSITLDVSSIPAGDGTFEYQVESESSFDYLVFCIDNPTCTSQDLVGSIVDGLDLLVELIPSRYLQMLKL